MPGQSFRGIIEYLRQVRESPAHGGASDGDLIERFLSRRDENAFAELVRKHGPMVLAACRRVLRQEQDAEDAFQATFLVLARRAASIRRQASVGSWLYGVAQRVALKARTAAARRPERGPWQAMAGESQDPASQAARAELRLVLDGEVARLPAKYRTPVVLCYLEGKTTEEAARELGWPKGTLTGRLARARDLLRRRLARRGLALSVVGLGTALVEQAAPVAISAPLFHRTAKAAAMTAAEARLAAVVSPTVAALAEGVLRAMFLTRLRLLGMILLGLALVCSPAGVLAYRALADEQQEKKVEKPVPAAPDGLELSDLLKRRVEVARQGLKAAQAELEAGHGTIESLVGWSRKIAESELDRGDRKAGLAALEEHIGRVRELEKASRARFEAGRITPQELAAAQYAWLDAEIWLARVKAKPAADAPLK